MRPDQPEFLLDVRQRSRVSTALLLSLLFHGLLLSLSLGGQGQGLPGLDLPWRERRLGADDLRVTLVPAPPALAEPLTDSTVLAPVAATAIDRVATAAQAAPLLVPAPAPALLALARPDTANWAVPSVPPALPAPVITAAPAASGPEILLPAPRETVLQKPVDLEAQERAQAEQDAKESKEKQAQQLAAARWVEAARQDAERQEAAKQVAMRQEAAARQELERAEAARLAAARQEAAKLESARLEAARQAAARQELERAESARLAAAQQDAAKQEMAKQEAARQETAKLEAANLAKAALAAARAEQDAKREAARRAMGRQLDEEAARRDAAALAARQSPSSLLPGASSLRRGRLFGRSDPNAEMLLYAELWSRKIELNQTFDMIRAAVKQPHTQPLVTVAVRSDGSIESVSFVRSSGVAEIDEGIRRILQSQAPFPPFHPALAREFDVIEIRRSWVFDSAIRLY